MKVGSYLFSGGRFSCTSDHMPYQCMRRYQGPKLTPAKRKIQVDFPFGERQSTSATMFVSKSSCNKISGMMSQRVLLMFVPNTV